MSGRITRFGAGEFLELFCESLVEVRSEGVAGENRRPCLEDRLRSVVVSGVSVGGTMPEVVVLSSWWGDFHFA